MKQYIFKTYIGDWSGDGHDKCEDYYITTNYPLAAIQQAYKDTCKKIGLQLHDEIDYTGLEEDNYSGSWRQIAIEYEDCQLREEVQEILMEHGCTLYGEPLTFEEDKSVGPEDMFELFMWFISYSMPEDFQYSKLEAESINGLGEMHLQIGYGCFH